MDVDCGMPRIRECHDGLFESAITERVIGAFHAVHGALGFGYVESVYQRALAIEIGKRGLGVRSHCPVDVTYDGVVVGAFRADLVVESRVVVQLASARTLAPEHELRLLNYLRATKLEVGVLLHFGPTAAYRRLVRQGPALIAAPRPSRGPHPALPRTACPTP